MSRRWKTVSWSCSHSNINSFVFIFLLIPYRNQTTNLTWDDFNLTTWHATQVQFSVLCETICIRIFFLGHVLSYNAVGLIFTSYIETGSLNPLHAVFNLQKNMIFVGTYIGRLGGRHKLRARERGDERASERKRRRGTLHKGDARIKSWVASDIGWIFNKWDHILFPKQRRNSSLVDWTDKSALPLSKSVLGFVRVCVCATNRTSITELRQWHAALALHAAAFAHVSKLQMQTDAATACACLSDI